MRSGTSKASAAPSNRSSKTAMSRMPALTHDELLDQQALFEFSVENFGKVPASFKIMARNSRLVNVANELAAVIMREASATTPELRWMVGHVVSRAAGCRVCSTNSAKNAEALSDSAAAKIDAIWEFESSPLFTDAERAALRVARGAGLIPNEVTDDDFADLRRHYSDEAVLEIIAVISLFGFFNRWNDTFSTDL